MSHHTSSKDFLLRISPGTLHKIPCDSFRYFFRNSSKHRNRNFFTACTLNIPSGIQLRYLIGIFQIYLLIFSLGFFFQNWYFPRFLQALFFGFSLRNKYIFLDILFFFLPSRCFSRSLNLDAHIFFECFEKLRHLAFLW